MQILGPHPAPLNPKLWVWAHVEQAPPLLGDSGTPKFVRCCFRYTKFTDKSGGGFFYSDESAQVAFLIYKQLLP